MLRDMLQVARNAPVDGRVRSQPTYCNAEGCGKATREGKEYCQEHTEFNAHANRVMQEIAARQAEDIELNKLVGRKRLSPKLTAFITNSSTAKEILLYLDFHGGASVERLVRELNLGVANKTNKTTTAFTDPDAAVLFIAKALVKAGRVTMRKSKRGSDMVIPKAKTESITEVIRRAS